MTPSDIFDLRYEVMKKMGFSGMEILSGMIDEYNVLIKQHPFFLFGKKLINKEEILKEFNEKTTQ